MGKRTISLLEGNGGFEWIRQCLKSRGVGDPVFPPHCETEENVMSGGHFDHQQSYLGYIADQLEHDIEYNNISYDEAIGKEYEKLYGFQLETKTVEFLSDVVSQLRRLESILHEYDLAVSGDTCEKTFQERVGIK